jgi:hypothetical protein
LEHVVTHKYLGFEIQDSKAMVTRAACKCQPSGSFSGHVQSHKTAINRVASNAVTAFEGGDCAPERIRMSVVNHFVHMEDISSEHVMEGTCRHILVCIQKYNESFPGLSPVEKVLIKVK